METRSPEVSSGAAFLTLQAYESAPHLNRLRFRLVRIFTFVPVSSRVRSPLILLCGPQCPLWLKLFAGSSTATREN